VIAAAVLFGFLLGDGGLDAIHLDPGSGLVSALATVALLVILFRDGLEVEKEMLQTAWHLPFRKLVLAMPITCVLVACVTKGLTDLNWTESFLVGALLSPTDPVLSSSVVTNPRVPRVIRHSLNLESGLNDGLALPAVLAFASALDPSETGFVWWKFVLQDLTVGLAAGLLVGLVASIVMPRGRGLLAPLVVAGVAYAVAVLPPHGNGLIAVFVCAIVLGVRRPDILASFERRSEIVLEAVKLAVFFVFGALLTGALFDDGWAAVGIVAFTLLAARPVAVFLSLAGTRTDTATRGFMGWFGPKGVATMTFSLLVLAKGIESGDRVFHIASLAVLVSIVAHGLTDRAGAEWIARRAERTQAVEVPA
jgi:NhaP-type Na+/H+ or K+/H+ antiporter